MPHSTGAAGQSWTRQAISNNTPDGGKDQRTSRGERAGTRKGTRKAHWRPRGQGHRAEVEKTGDKDKNKKNAPQKQQTKTKKHRWQQRQGRQKQQSKTKQHERDRETGVAQVENRRGTGKFGWRAEQSVAGRRAGGGGSAEKKANAERAVGSVWLGVGEGARSAEGRLIGIVRCGHRASRQNKEN